MKIGGGVYETMKEALDAAGEVMPKGIDFKILCPGIVVRGWRWEAEMTRKQLHELAQRTRDPSTLHPAIINGMKENKVGPWMDDVE